MEVKPNMLITETHPAAALDTNQMVKTPVIGVDTCNIMQHMQCTSYCTSITTPSGKFSVVVCGNNPVNWESY
jgi:hypothetical protein